MNISIGSIRDLYKLDSIIRYNTHPRIKNETDASHMYYVALFTMMLCEELDVSLDIKAKAIEMALVHDIPEMVTNDITHDAKKMMPEIKPILEKYENEFLEQHYLRQFVMMQYPNSQDEKIAFKIMILADTISVLQYSINEINLGNSYIEDWPKKTRERIENIKKELERMGVSCQRITI